MVGQSPGKQHSAIIPQHFWVIARLVPPDNKQPCPNQEQQATKQIVTAKEEGSCD
jgi:hypothetical protein